jgi:hypothetical protein
MLHGVADEPCGWVGEEDAGLLRPAHLYTAQEVRARPCPIPAAAGVYGWYFDRVPAGVPTDGCHRVDGAHLLYVGISPKAAPRGGGRPSRQTIRTRIRYHYRGNAEGSTLRLTLGALLADELGIRLQRVGSGGRLTYGDRERELTEWMAAHARVSWTVCDEPWSLEKRLIATLALPLNLDQSTHPFRPVLSSLRAVQRLAARSGR